jgi:hypothetical protein
MCFVVDVRTTKRAHHDVDEHDEYTAARDLGMSGSQMLSMEQDPQAKRHVHVGGKR